jgi:hypothetical protein
MVYDAVTLHHSAIVKQHLVETRNINIEELLEKHENTYSDYEKLHIHITTVRPSTQIFGFSYLQLQLALLLPPAPSEQPVASLPIALSLCLLHPTIHSPSTFGQDGYVCQLVQLQVLVHLADMPVL